MHSFVGTVRKEGLGEWCPVSNAFPPRQMAESCPLSHLDLSFCYKVSKESLDIVVTTLKAKGCLKRFVSLGMGFSPITVELLSSVPSLTHLCLCGVTELSDAMIGVVSVRAYVLQCLDHVYSLSLGLCTVWLT